MCAEAWLPGHAALDRERHCPDDALQGSGLQVHNLQHCGSLPRPHGKAAFEASDWPSLSLSLSPCRALMHIQLPALPLKLVSAVSQMTTMHRWVGGSAQPPLCQGLPG